MPRKPKLNPEALEELENELLSRLATGEEVPPGAAELVNSPEFAQRLAQRKQEMALQNRQMARHVLSPVAIGSQGRGIDT